MMRSFPLRLAGLALVAGPLMYSVSPSVLLPAQAQELTRDEILRQHQELAREHGQSLGQPEAMPAGGEDLDAPAESPAPRSSRRAARRQSGEGVETEGSLTAQLLTRVTSLENQVRQMQGQLEQLTNEVHRNQADVTKQIGDMQFAAQNGGGGLGGGAAAVESPRAARAPAAVEKPAPRAEETPRTAAQFLQAARTALRSHHYAESLSAAQQAQSLSHSSAERSEALYVEAQAAAGQKNYRQSAVAYYDAYGKAPKSARAPGALLGVSASMLALGNKGAACQALDKLQKEFPAASPSVKASEKAFRKRAACP
ncbi:tetratricopeptide repeat protein [Oecophyllibacter saccharovorans]|uniref:tetratricopeptide repeat protein n=1 Tax=Oecophyllibacter saccharovorans TaxID=2558360 RepID=UPI001F4FD6BD|nr:hypothetical protein [Oecophyllibacter saccharovorans]